MAIKHIEIDEEYGIVSGYAVETSAVNVDNYLAEYTDKHSDISQWLKDNLTRVALLKNIEIGEEFRQQGLGTLMLCNFKAFARQSNAQAILLIADRAEVQIEGFNLKDWYIRHNFVSIAETGCGNLMCYPVAVGLALRQELDK